MNKEDQNIQIEAYYLNDPVKLPYQTNFIEEENSCFIVRPEWRNLEKTDSKNSENKIISKTFLGSTIRYKIGTNKTKNGILVVDKSSNDSAVFNPGDYVKINILQDWKIEL